MANAEEVIFVSQFIGGIFHAVKYSAPKLAFGMSNNVGQTLIF